MEWARLDASTDSMTVQEFVDGVKAGSVKDKYLFDVSLPLFLPELQEKITVPQYFESGNLLKMTREGTMYR